MVVQKLATFCRKQKIAKSCELSKRCTESCCCELSRVTSLLNQSARAFALGYFLNRTLRNVKMSYLQRTSSVAHVHLDRARCENYNRKQPFLKIIFFRKIRERCQVIFSHLHITYSIHFWALRYIHTSR